MKLRALIALLLLIWSPAAFAQAAPWRFTEAAGQVEVRRGAQIAAARRGATVAPGDMISTGANGRAVLVRGRDFVIVSPRTQLRVPTAGEAGGSQHVRMLQASGRAQYRIERRSTPHFGVRTPHLVALVKGTVFTVTVGEEGASVAVTEGRVEVATLSGEMSQMVEPGFAARVSAADPARLSHGESAEARAEIARETVSNRGGSSVEHRNDDGGNGNGGASDGTRNQPDMPRLEYDSLAADSRGGSARSEEVSRVRETETRLADALAQQAQLPGNNAGGNGNGGGNGGNGNGNGGGIPVTAPAPAPVVPAVPVPAPGSSGSGGSNPGPGSGPPAIPPPSQPAPAPSTPAPAPSSPAPVPSEPAPAPAAPTPAPSTPAPAPSTPPPAPSTPAPAPTPAPTPAPAPSTPPPAPSTPPPAPAPSPLTPGPAPSEPAPAPVEPAPPPVVAPPTAPSPGTPVATTPPPTTPPAGPPPPPTSQPNEPSRCLLGLICL